MTTGMSINTKEEEKQLHLSLLRRSLDIIELLYHPTDPWRKRLKAELISEIRVVLKDQLSSTDEP